MQPFRFFDLPGDLQQHILDLHYGNTATVKAGIEPTSPYDGIAELYAESSYKSIYETTISISPFLVSRRFNNEALYALERARNNTMATICLSRVPSLPHHFLLHTVASTRVTLDYKFNIAVFREKLPNLRILHLQFDEQYFYTSRLDPLNLAVQFPDTHATLADVLRGKHDEKLATATRKDLFDKMSTVGVKTRQCLRGIAITCRESLELFNILEWRDESDACGLTWLFLWVEYEFKDGKACVKAKWFDNSHEDGGITKTPEEAVRLIEKYSG